jgi:hypothetical protein
MIRFLIVVGLILGLVLGLGFYYGAFRVATESADGMTHITLTVDQHRVPWINQTTEKTQSTE